MPGDGDSFEFFDKAEVEKPKGTSKSKVGLKPKQNFTMLEKLLDVSNLYDQDYLKKSNFKRNPSIFETEFNLIEKKKLPPEFVFNPERVIFKIEQEDTLYHSKEHRLFCKMNEERTRFYFQDQK